MVNTKDREQAIIQAVESIQALPDPSIKDGLMRQLMDSLTVTEVTSLALGFSREKWGEDLEGYGEILLQVYEMAGIPLDIENRYLPKEVIQRMQDAQPLLKEFGQCLNKLVKALKDPD